MKDQKIREEKTEFQRASMNYYKNYLKEKVNDSLEEIDYE